MPLPHWLVLRADAHSKRPFLFLSLELCPSQGQNNTSNKRDMGQSLAFSPCRYCSPRCALFSFSYQHGEYVDPKLIPGTFIPADNKSNDYHIDRVAQRSFSGLDHGVGHSKSLFVMPPYATLRSLRCSREGLRCFFACHSCHGSHDQHDRMIPSQTMHISIETLDTCCLISPCKIPANLPHNPRRGPPRWPREPHRKTPKSSRTFALGTLGYGLGCPHGGAGHVCGNLRSIATRMGCP
jgi:hypothetical protein